MMRVNDAPLHIEVVYAGPQRVIAKVFRLAAGACVADALRLAAADPDFADVDLWNSALGIFGRLTHADYVLQEGDRLEIYRPLTTDPKAARRARAQQSRKKA
ncbi:MAG TPA: RnfH family protein [Steroidobacteraceae bacterium]|nr:RnfH family protein [Steroidobacteraceae bacterium]